MLGKYILNSLVLVDDDENGENEFVLLPKQILDNMITNHFIEEMMLEPSIEHWFEMVYWRRKKYNCYVRYLSFMRRDKSGCTCAVYTFTFPDNIEMIYEHSVPV